MDTLGFRRTDKRIEGLAWKRKRRRFARWRSCRAPSSWTCSSTPGSPRSRCIGQPRLACSPWWMRSPSTRSSSRSWIGSPSRHRTIATLMRYVDEHDRTQTQKTLGEVGPAGVAAEATGRAAPRHDGSRLTEPARAMPILERAACAACEIVPAFDRQHVAQRRRPVDERLRTHGAEHLRGSRLRCGRERRVSWRPHREAHEYYGLRLPVVGTVSNGL